MKEENIKLLFDELILKELMFKAYALGMDDSLNDNLGDDEAALIAANRLFDIIDDKMQQLRRASEVRIEAKQPCFYITQFCDYLIYQNIDITSDDIIEELNLN